MWEKREFFPDSNLSSVFLPIHEDSLEYKEDIVTRNLFPTTCSNSPASALGLGKRVRDGNAENLWNFLCGLSRGDGRLFRTRQLDWFHHVLSPLHSRSAGIHKVQKVAGTISLNFNPFDHVQ